MPGRIIFARTIDRIVRIHCPDVRIAALFGCLAASPDMPGPTAPPLDIRIVHSGPDHYELETDEVVPDQRLIGTAHFVFERVTGILQSCLKREYDSGALLDAASIVVHGRRILIISDRNHVRQSLVLQCLNDGATVETDRHVVFRDGMLTAAPVPLQVFEGTARACPDLTERVMAAPFFENWDGDRIFCLEPRTPGGAWRICSGPPHAIIVIEANAGGRSSAGRYPRELVFQALLQSAHFGAAGRAPNLAGLHVLSRSAEGWKLRVGSLGDAARHVKLIARSAGGSLSW